MSAIYHCAAGGATIKKWQKLWAICLAVSEDFRSRNIIIMGSGFLDLNLHKVAGLVSASNVDFNFKSYEFGKS